jgi:hypothetical protein
MALGTPAAATTKKFVLGGLSQAAAFKRVKNGAQLFQFTWRQRPGVVAIVAPG